MIDFVRKNSRVVLAYLLYYSGVLWILALVRFRNGGVILTYHRVLPISADTFSADGIVVKPETFAKHMRFLKRWFRVLSVQELIQYFDSGKPLPSRSCVITFDDGWYDNFVHAMPILNSQQLPAVVFLATDYVGSNRCFWQEELSRLFYEAASTSGAPRDLAARLLKIDPQSLSPGALRSAIRTVIDRLKHQSSEHIELTASELKTALNSTGVNTQQRGDDRFMTWDEARQMAQDSTMSLGAHGCSHRPLTELTETEASHELVSSRDEISARAGATSDTIAFPNGNYDDATVRLTRSNGYRLAFTTDRGWLNSQCDPLRLPRINISEPATKSIPEFVCVLLLVFQRLRRPNPVY